MEEVHVEQKDRPIQQGDDGDFLFVIEKGTPCISPLYGHKKCTVVVQSLDMSSPQQ